MRQASSDCSRQTTGPLQRYFCGRAVGLGVGVGVFEWPVESCATNFCRMRRAGLGLKPGWVCSLRIGRCMVCIGLGLGLFMCGSDRGNTKLPDRVRRAHLDAAAGFVAAASRCVRCSPPSPRRREIGSIWFRGGRTTKFFAAAFMRQEGAPEESCRAPVHEQKQSSWFMRSASFFKMLRLVSCMERRGARVAPRMLAGSRTRVRVRRHRLLFGFEFMGNHLCFLTD